MDQFMKHISRIHRGANRWREAMLNEEELNGIQQVYLFHICRHPGISQEQLRAKILVNKSNVARQLSSLEKMGYVKRHVSQADKRLYEVFPTDRAMLIYPKIVYLMEEWNERLLEDLNPQEREMFIGVLTKISHKAKQFSKKGENEDE